MFTNFLKRIAYFLPTFFAITLLTFGISKIAPGDPVEMVLAGNSRQGDQLSDKMATQKAYEAQSEKMGLHLPTFYFKCTHQAYPDTLYKRRKKNEREMLQALIESYGNWKQIASFYRALKLFEYQLYKTSTSSRNFKLIKNLKEKTNHIWNAYVKEDIHRYINQINLTINAEVSDSALVRSIDSIGYAALKLNKAYDAVVLQATPSKKYFPKCIWHGLDNQYHRWMFGDKPIRYKKKQLFTISNALPTTKHAIEEAGFYRISYKSKTDQRTIRKLASQDTLYLNQLGFTLDTPNVYILERLYNYNPTQTSGGFLRGDLGYSYLDGRPVFSIIKEALKWSFILSILTILIIYMVSVPIGIYAAVKKGQFFDRASTVVLFVLYSLPTFWIATLCVVFLTTSEYGMNWFPTYGVGDNLLTTSSTWWDILKTRTYHLILPLFCLVYGSFAFLSRQMRGAVSDALLEDYIRTARAKGLSSYVVVLKHALKNSLIVIVTLLAGLLPSLISGSFIIETIFNIPGMGSVGLHSITARNYPVVYSILLISSILTMLGVLFSDMLYGIIDPRISFNKKTQ